MLAAARVRQPLSHRLAARIARIGAWRSRRRGRAGRQEGRPEDSQSDLAIAQLAHDVRNHLMVMIGCAETMHRHVPHACADREFEELCRAADRASNLIRELLTASRPHASARGRVDLNRIAAEAAETLSRLAGYSIRVRVQVTPAQVEVVAHAIEIERLLLNLGLNACDAMPDGGVLTIETALVDRAPHGRTGPRRHVRLTVSDTGHGMTPEVKARMFEPFFTTKAMGTGLGLSSVAFTVRQLQGMVSVESHPGRGTSITVELPRAPELPRAEEPTRS